MAGLHTTGHDDGIPLVMRDPGAYVGLTIPPQAGCSCVQCRGYRGELSSDTTLESNTPPPSPSLEARVRAVRDELTVLAQLHKRSAMHYWQGRSAGAREAAYLLGCALDDTLTDDDLEQTGYAPRPDTTPDARDALDALPAAEPDARDARIAELEMDLQAHDDLIGVLSEQNLQLERYNVRLADTLENQIGMTDRAHTDAALLDAADKENARKIASLTACNAVLQAEVKQQQRQIAVLWEMVRAAVGEVGA